jgi:glutaredoxin
LLTQKGYEIEERVIGDRFTKEQLLEVLPLAKTVPQIFLDDKYIGGCDDLLKYFNTEKASTPKIYESPDGGKTIYERDFRAAPSTRTVVKTAIQKQWNIVLDSQNEVTK